MFGSSRAARIAAPTRLIDAEIVWRYSQHTVWTATQAASRRGLVEERDGSYVATDEVTGKYNTYRTLADAMQAIEAPVVGRP